MTDSPTVESDLESVQAALPPAIALFRDNARLVGFAAGVLAKLAAWGVPGAGKYHDALLAIPGILDWLDANVPRLIAVEKAIAPAPRPGPPITEADWSNGIPQPQAVDNPSGAIGG